MQTELNEVPLPVQPGQKIDVNKYNIKNMRMAKFLQTIATTALSIIEMDSSNTSASVTGDDARNIQLAMNLVKQDLDWSIEYQDGPKGQHELVHDILFPTANQIALMGNLKLRSVNMELYNYFMVALGSEAGQMQVWIGEQSTGKLTRGFEILKAVVDKTVGTGVAETEGGPINTGFMAPDNSHLGRLVPNVTGTVSPQVREPSADNRPDSIVDAADAERA